MESLLIDVDLRGRLRRALPRIVIGSLIGSAAMAMAVSGIDWSAVKRSLLQMRLSMTLVALASVVVMVSLNVLRWRLLFATDQRRIDGVGLAGALLIGQMANIIIPARVGEIVRIYLISRREELSWTRVVATIALEKAADLIMFAISIGILLAGMAMPEWMSRTGAGIAGASALVFVATLALTFWNEGFLRLVRWLSARLPTAWTKRIVGGSDAALIVFRSQRDWRKALSLWALSAVILLVSISTNYFVFQAMRLQLPFVAALFLSVALRIGVAPPALPGQLGVFQYVVILALAMFGVDRTTALSYSFALYAIALGPVLLAGSAALIAVRWTPRDQNP